MALAATAALEISVDSYATLSQVKVFVPYMTLNSDDTPTKAQAFQVIRASFQAVNTLLTTVGYKIPVASGNGTAIRFLADFQCLGVASRLEMIAATRGGGSVEIAKEYARQYQQTFKLIEEGRLKIFDVTLAGDYQVRRDQRAITYQFNPSEGVEQSPTFTRDMDW